MRERVGGGGRGEEGSEVNYLNERREVNYLNERREVVEDRP